MRPPSDALRRAISSHPDRDRIDPERARAEHAAYVRTLEASGLAVTLLPPEADMPDACFTWDTILAFPQPGDASAVLLVAARPGAPSRRPEVESVLVCARRLAPGAEVVEIDDPGTLDGGDVITRQCGRPHRLSRVSLSGRGSIAPGIRDHAAARPAIDRDTIRISIAGCGGPGRGPG